MGGTVLGVSSDKISDSKRVHSKSELPFDLICDDGANVIREYGLFHHDPFHDLDIALPANILIDRNGKIAWMHVADAVQDRVDPGVVIEQIEALPK